MKKWIAFILALILCLSLCACGEAAAEDEREAEYKKAMKLLESGKYDKALEKFIELEDYEDSEAMVDKINAYEDALELLEKGELENAYLAFKELGDFGDVPEILEDFSFVETSVNTYENGKNTSSSEYTYQNGRLSVITIYEQDGNKVNCYYKRYTYNDQKNSTKIETVTKNGDVTMTEEYEYDANGNETYYKLTVPKTNTYQWWYYYYDDAGNQIQSDSYSLFHENGYEPSYTIYHEYDEHNNVVRIYYMRDGEMTSEYLHKNTYDDAGNLIQVEASASTITYEYDEAGQMIRETYNYKNGSVWDTRYEYDRYGNQIRKSSDTTVHVTEYAIMYTGDK